MTIPVGNGPYAIAVGRDGVWVSEQFGGVVDRIDPATNRVAERIPVGNRPAGLALVGGTLWVGGPCDGRRASRRDAARARWTGGVRLPGPCPRLRAQARSRSSRVIGDGLFAAVQRAAGRDGTQIVPDLAVTLPRATGRRGAPTDSCCAPASTTQLEARSARATSGPRSSGSGRSGRSRRRPHRGRASWGGRSLAPRNARIGLDAADLLARHRRRSRRRLRSSPSTSPRPDPEFLHKLSLDFAYILPAGTPPRAADIRPVPATGPYMVAAYRAQPRPRAGPQPALSRVVAGRSARRLSRSDRTAPRRPAIPPEPMPSCAGEADDAGGQAGWHRATNGAWALHPARGPDARRAAAHDHPADPQHAPAALRRRARAPRTQLRHRPSRLSCARSEAPSAATPTCQILPPNFPGYVRYCPYSAPDLRPARRLVAASGTRGASRVDHMVRQVPGPGSPAGRCARCAGSAIRLR